MIVRMKQDQTKSDIEILIEYPEMSKTVMRIQAVIKSADSVIRCEDDTDKIVLLKVSDIYYIESVDKRIFIYDINKVYRCELPLYQLIEKLNHYGFVQISKSCILNLGVLVSVKPIFNARMEAVLKNQEKLNISRKYLPLIRQKLEEL